MPRMGFMGFYGASLQYDYHFPTRDVAPVTNPASGGDDSATIAIGTTVTQAAGLTVGGSSLYSVSFTDTQMRFDFTTTALWTAGYTGDGRGSSPVEYNGPVFTDKTDTLAPIVNVTLKSNISGLTKSDLTFNSDKVSIDFTGIKVTPHSYITLTFAFQKVINGTARGETLTGTSASETINAGAGDDTLYGMAGNDTLKGGAGKDTLYGGIGKDLLEGGAGSDELYGGAGLDRFLFRSVSDMGNSKTDTDTIHDLSFGEKIDFTRIDANTLTAKNDAFSFIGKKDFTGHAGELRYDKEVGATYIYGDVNGDGTADFVLHIDKAMTVTPGYLLL